MVSDIDIIAMTFLSAINGEDLTNPLRFGRQKPNNNCRREHQGPRNQMISRSVRAKLGFMLYQK